MLFCKTGFGFFWGVQLVLLFTYVRYLCLVLPCLPYHSTLLHSTLLYSYGTVSELQAWDLEIVSRVRLGCVSVCLCLRQRLLHFTASTKSASTHLTNPSFLTNRQHPQSKQTRAQKRPPGLIFPTRAMGDEVGSFLSSPLLSSLSRIPFPCLTSSPPIRTGRLPPRTPPRILPPQQHVPAQRAARLARDAGPGRAPAQHGHGRRGQLLPACRRGAWELYVPLSFLPPFLILFFFAGRRVG